MCGEVNRIKIDKFFARLTVFCTICAVTRVQLELRDVTVAFDGKAILDRVNLTVGAGESVVIIGPSGQGKTLILKLLAGLIEPDAGQALVNGECLATMPVARRDQLRLRMGMLFQRNALFDSLTVFENVAFPLREKGAVSPAAISERVLEYLNHVGLAEARDLRPDEISGGMQKRLGIARALALEPEIVFYDDPTAGLDPITSRQVIELNQRAAGRASIQPGGRHQRNDPRLPAGRPHRDGKRG